MIQAIIEGRKTQTRRVIKLKGYSQDIWNECVPHNGKVAELLGEPYLKVPYDPITDRSGARITAHYGIGETVYVKEAHYRYGWWVRDGFTKSGNQKWRFKHAPSLQTDYIGGEDFRYSDNLPDDVKPNSYRGEGWYKRSPLFMWGWMARYFITITDVRAERLGNMISGDCLAEGITASDEDGIGQQGIKLDYKFRQFWNSINAKWKRVYNTELKIYEFWQFPWCEEDAKPIPKTTQHPERYHCVPNPWDFAYTFKQDKEKMR